MITSFLFESAAPLPLDEIRAHLDALPTARRDKWDNDVYIVVDDPRTLEHVIDAREASQVGYSRVAALVALSDTRVDFSLQTQDLEVVRAFARWARARYHVAILDERFKDITAECDDHLDHLFGPSRKRRLIPIGFFRELKHGRADGPSLRSLMGNYFDTQGQVDPSAGLRQRHINQISTQSPGAPTKTSSPTTAPVIAPAPTASNPPAPGVTSETSALQYPDARSGGMQ
jgi:hypothetical protein